MAAPRQITAADIAPISVPCVENLDPNNLTRFRAAMAKMRTGAAPAKIAFIGNSKTAGVGAVRATSYPAAFTKRLAALGVPANQDAFWGNANFNGGAALGGATLTGYTGYNPQVVWSSLTAWAASAATGGISHGTLGGSLISMAGAGGTLSFTPSIPVDQFTIWYVQNTGLGSFNANVDGGANTTINGNAAAALKSANISAGTLGTHTLNISWASGGVSYLVGVTCRNTGSPALEVYNMGWGASTTTEMAGQTSRVWNVLNALPVVAPDLTFIAMDTNDYTPSYGPVDLPTYSANLQALITAAKQTGDCAIICEIPSASSRQTYAIQNQYHAVQHSLAASNGCVLFDVTKRWGSNYETMQPYGYYSDQTHGTPVAYSDQGNWIAGVLASVI